MMLFFKAVLVMIVTLGIAGLITFVSVWLINTDLYSAVKGGWSSMCDYLPKSFYLMTGFVVTIYFLFSTILYFLINPLSGYMAGNTGIIGDSYGTLNALFSALGFGIVIVSLFEQQKRLRDQQKELDTNKSLMNKQLFENSFFKMLEMHNNIVKDMDIIIKGKIAYAGRDCFRFFRKRFIKSHSAAKYNLQSKDELIIINAAYITFYNRYQSDLGHYFRNIYNIIKFVDNSHVSDKEMYVNYIRAQLSSHELVMLFYNCLSMYGCERFKPYVQDYEFLENMDFSLLIDSSHTDLYQKKAFGKSLL